MADNLVAMACTQAWQIALLIVLVAAVARGLAGRRPHLAHVLWLLVLVKCLTPPVLSSPIGLFSRLLPPRYAPADLPESTIDSERARTKPIDSSSELVQPAGSDKPRYAVEQVLPIDASNMPRGRRYEFPPLHREFAIDRTGAADNALAAPAGNDHHRESELPPAPYTSASAGPATISTLSALRRLLEAALVSCAIAWLGGSAAIVVLAVHRWRMCVRDLKSAGTISRPDLETLLARLARRLRIRREVRLLIRHSRIGPAVIGILRPTIVLPAVVVAGKSAAELEPILVHELLHVRRGDLWVGAMQVAAQAIWWFHPLVWLANRLATRAAEACCDEETIAELGGDPARYARSLLDVLEQRRQLVAVPVFPGIKPIDLTRQRLERIMELRKGCRRRTPWWCWIVLLAATAVTLPGAALIVSAEQPVPPKQADATATYDAADAPAAIEQAPAAERPDDAAAKAEAALFELVTQFNEALSQKRFDEAHEIAKKAQALQPNSPVSELMLVKARRALQLPKERAHLTREEERIEKNLGRKITLHRAAPLTEMMDLLAAEGEINILLDSAGLEAARVRRNQPVALNVDELPLRDVFDRLLEPLKLDYFIRRNVLKISNRHTAALEDHSCRECHRGKQMVVDSIWMGDFDAAHQRAKELKQPLLVVFDLNACAPCRLMLRDVFDSAEGRPLVHPEFVTVKVNLNDPANRQWQQKFDVTAVPTTLVLDLDEKVVSRSEGYNSDERAKHLQTLRGLAERFARKPVNAAPEAGNAAIPRPHAHDLVAKHYAVGDLFDPNLNGLAGIPVPSVYESLIGQIKRAVAPESWTDNGGNGSIAAGGGVKASLTIRQTPAIHEQIDRYFAELRARRDPLRPVEELILKTYAVGDLFEPDARSRTGVVAPISFDRLVNGIKAAIRPESWTDFGGAGSMESYFTTGSLVVRQTPEVHDQLGRFFAELRTKQEMTRRGADNRGPAAVPAERKPVPDAPVPNPGAAFEWRHKTGGWFVRVTDDIGEQRDTAGGRPRTTLSVRLRIDGPNGEPEQTMTLAADKYQSSEQATYAWIGSVQSRIIDPDGGDKPRPLSIELSGQVTFRFGDIEAQADSGTLVISMPEEKRAVPGNSPMVELYLQGGVQWKCDMLKAEAQSLSADFGTRGRRDAWKLGLYNLGLNGGRIEDERFSGSADGISVGFFDATRWPPLPAGTVSGPPQRLEFSGNARVFRASDGAGPPDQGVSAEFIVWTPHQSKLEVLSQAAWGQGPQIRHAKPGEKIAVIGKDDVQTVTRIDPVEFEAKQENLQKLQEVSTKTYAINDLLNVDPALHVTVAGGRLPASYKEVPSPNRQASEIVTWITAITGAHAWDRSDMQATINIAGNGTGLEVRQSELVHGQIADLLAQWRRPKDKTALHVQVMHLLSGASPKDLGLERDPTAVEGKRAILSEKELQALRESLSRPNDRIRETSAGATLLHCQSSRWHFACLERPDRKEVPTLPIIPCVQRQKWVYLSFATSLQDLADDAGRARYRATAIPAGQSLLVDVTEELLLSGWGGDTDAIPPTRNERALLLITPQVVAVEYPEEVLGVEPRPASGAASAP